MNPLKEKKGFVIFGAILIVVLVAAFAAYQITGSMGIEDRYNKAVGLTPSPEDGGGGTLLGFSAEGNPVLYVIILGILVACSYVAYRRFRI
jgi:hypothetical protein